MKRSNRHNAQLVVANFRQWSRKGYAVFASLGRTIRIATLKTVVTSVFGGKKGILVNLFPFMDFAGDKDQDEEYLPNDTLCAELTLCQSLMAIVMSQPAVAVCEAYLINTFDNINPVGSCRQGFLLI